MPARQEPILPVESVSVDGIAFMGQPTAKSVMLVFSDFQCPFCRKFALTEMPSVVSSYVDSGRIQFGFVHVPIEKIHPLAIPAAKAAACSGRQGKFWRMHDFLFADSNNLQQESLLRGVREVELSNKEFSACMLETRLPELDLNAALVARLMVTGTPTFYLGRLESDGRLRLIDRFEGARPSSVLQSKLDGLLKEAQQ